MSIDFSTLDGTSLGKLMRKKGFRFQRLVIEGIDNRAVFEQNAPDMPDQEIALFHESISSGDDYVALLGNRLEAAFEERSPLPVVRFADGEYEFYRQSMKCNGLYRQAESVQAIRSALPFHVSALRELASSGILAPLVFPGNIRRPRGIHAFFRWRKDTGDLALRFLDFLENNGVVLTKSSYVPFYAVYALLSSSRFASMVDGRTVCVVGSDFDGAACSSWFERAGSRPQLIHLPIPDSYVATRWGSIREGVIRSVPGNPDCFLVGAGVGALQICVDLSRLFSVPAIDSGHILNAMNDLLHKSQGPRLFTHHR